MTAAKAWSDTETTKLMEMRSGGFSVVAMARTLGRSENSIRGRLQWLEMTSAQRQAKRDGINRRRRHDGKGPRAIAAMKTPERPRAIPVSVLADRDNRAKAPRSLTALAFGDPAPGQSALDKRGRA